MRNANRRLVGVALEGANDVGVIDVEHLRVRIVSVVRFDGRTQQPFPNGVHFARAAVTNLVLDQYSDAHRGSASTAFLGGTQCVGTP
jgi:hypothetical protein